MSWLDIVLILVIAGIAVLGMVRGFGKAVFDALLLYAALFAANALSLPLATAVRFHSGAAINHAYAFVILFIAFGALAILLSRFVYGLTLLDTGMFERLLGLAAGVAAAMILCHGIVQPIAMADPNRQAGAQLVQNGVLTSEMYSFHTYHDVIDTITGATTYRRELPNVGG